MGHVRLLLGEADSSFFTGCHYFVPLWDKSYDIYESYIERTPFSTNGKLISGTFAYSRHVGSSC